MTCPEQIGFPPDDYRLGFLRMIVGATPPSLKMALDHGPKTTCNGTCSGHTPLPTCWSAVGLAGTVLGNTPSVMGTTFRNDLCTGPSDSESLSQPWQGSQWPTPFPGASSATFHRAQILDGRALDALDRLAKSDPPRFGSVSSDPDEMLHRLQCSQNISARQLHLRFTQG